MTPEKTRTFAFAHHRSMPHRSSSSSKSTVRHTSSAVSAYIAIHSRLPSPDGATRAYSPPAAAAIPLSGVVPTSLASTSGGAPTASPSQSARSHVRYSSSPHAAKRAGQSPAWIWTISTSLERNTSDSTNNTTSETMHDCQKTCFPKFFKFDGLSRLLYMLLA